MKNVLLGTVVGLVGCTSASGTVTPTVTNQAPADPAPKLIHLTQADAGKSVTLAVGGDLTVTLKEDPSRNGKWFPPPDATFLNLTDEVKRTYSPTSQDRRFTYHAHVPGQGVLTFTYKEGNTVIDTVNYTITGQ